jgi:hypothetical protein
MGLEDKMLASADVMTAAQMAADTKERIPLY